MSPDEIVGFVQVSKVRRRVAKAAIKLVNSYRFDFAGDIRSNEVLGGSSTRLRREIKGAAHNLFDDALMKIDTRPELGVSSGHFYEAKGFSIRYNVYEGNDKRSC